MNMGKSLREKLSGGDLRSIGEANLVIGDIKNQSEFDILFQYLYDNERLIVMRAADAIEKISLTHSEYLYSHKIDIINLCSSATDIELKWHLALLISRPSLLVSEQTIAFNILKKWAINPKESRIVRVNAIQSLYELSKQNSSFKTGFSSIINIVQEENIASIDARIRKILTSEV
ncbi:MAG: hypothetical protein ABF682_02455 [Liquorilactobacillus sp.]|uniref:hypothetical protein n=1 Tax=Liquorilactobacillus sp. TaxID=2767923 RepID=UPI0039E9EC65